MRSVTIIMRDGIRYCADCGACVDSDLPAAVGTCDCEPYGGLQPPGVGEVLESMPQLDRERTQQ